jgi:hypothetical protein
MYVGNANLESSFLFLAASGVESERHAGDSLDADAARMPPVCMRMPSFSRRYLTCSTEGSTSRST